MDRARGAFIKGQADETGTSRHAARFTIARACFRGLKLSRLGIGTSLGEDRPNGSAYGPGLRAALAGGINVIDTAPTYGAQTCERAVGRALAASIQVGRVARDEVFVASKVGFVPRLVRGRKVARRRVEVLARRLGLEADDFLAASHSIAPAFVSDQIAMSRRNLGLETIDAYLLHNPELQSAHLSRREFERRLSKAFEALEAACEAGQIGCYGISSWDAFRCRRDDARHLDIDFLLRRARSVGGARHRFGVIEAPYNRAAPQLALRHAGTSLFDAASAHGLLLLTSSTLDGGRIGPGQAISFVLKTPGIGSSLIGMRSRDHVAQALVLARQG